MMIYNALFDNRNIPHTTNVCRNMKYGKQLVVVVKRNKVRFYILWAPIFLSHNRAVIIDLFPKIKGMWVQVFPRDYSLFLIHTFYCDEKQLKLE